VRIGLLHELRDGVAEEVGGAFDAAVEVLRALGAEVTDSAVPDLHLVNDIGFALIEAEAASFHSAWLRERPDDYAPQTRLGLEAGHAMPATQYVDAQRLRLRFNRQFNALFERFDVLCSPTVQTLPTLLDSEHELSGSHQQWDIRHTILANVTGVPGVAVPSGFSADGLPASIQFMAAPFADATALQVAEAFQSATDWHRRRPPAFA
jgi:aspartyl-tRNA(Asn)/glutamyl-tRNA(Gln) amidotransferase subunit A